MELKTLWQIESWTCPPDPLKSWNFSEHPKASNLSLQDWIFQKFVLFTTFWVWVFAKHFEWKTGGDRVLLESFRIVRGLRICQRLVSARGIDLRWKNVQLILDRVLWVLSAGTKSWKSERDHFWWKLSDARPGTRIRYNRFRRASTSESRCFPEPLSFWDVIRDGTALVQESGKLGELTR